MQPLAGAIENVPRFLKSGEFVALKDNLEGQGFTVVSGLVSALDFGVAQRRIRGVVLFARGIVPRLPKRKPRRKPAVRRALRGLPLKPDGQNDHEDTEHEAPTGEHHALGVDADVMLLSLADDRVARVMVGGVPVRVFLADRVDHKPAILLGLLHKTVNSRLGDGGMVEPVEVGMPDEEPLPFPRSPAGYCDGPPS